MKQSSLVFLRKSHIKHIYYTLLVGRPHQHKELGRSQKVLYTQQADKWLSLTQQGRQTKMVAVAKQQPPG
jgi:hypothetical protein